MKPNHKQLSAAHHPYMAGASPTTSATKSNHTIIDSAPSADEVARKVYVTHGNQRLLPGDELQRWLEAEAQLVAEGNDPPVHGTPNRAQPHLSRTFRQERISL